MSSNEFITAGFKIIKETMAPESYRCLVDNLLYDNLADCITSTDIKDSGQHTVADLISLMKRCLPC